jgi:hypothetical protein
VRPRLCGTLVRRVGYDIAGAGGGPGDLCVNRGFRLPKQGMDEPARPEIVTEFGPWLNELQYKDPVERDGRVFDSYGIVFVPNPYGEGRYQA